MWAESSVFYQIYPLGFCGAPFENDGVLEHRILKVLDWIPHMKKLGITAIYFSPLFESDTHGYNTRDYTLIDKRLGTNEDFAQVCKTLHENGIRVVLDGVFNHVGRGFWAFRDVLEKREASEYVSWFARIAFDGNSNYNDGLWYEGWEGNYDLVKLNLGNPAVREHIFNAVAGWVKEFDIDGLRLDVAYCLSQDFVSDLRRHCNDLKEDFFLVGEMLHGDYNPLMNAGLDSVTNYECYKGLHSALNSYNLFEIVHSLLRQYGPEQWTLYKGKHLLAFADNHDVTRAASILQNPRHLPLIYALVFGMPGIPCIYYGSEWGLTGRKEDGDPALRTCPEAPEWNELTDLISRMAAAKASSEALNYGDFTSVVLTNRQCIFQRRSEHERVLVALNIDEHPFTAHFDAGCGQATDLITGELHDFGGGSELPPYSAYFWKCEH